MLRTLEFFSLLCAARGILCNEALCPKEWVSSTQRGDHFCDYACMNGPCGYDGATDSYTTSDCWLTQCFESGLGDGQCWLGFLDPACGWDLGDCGYCAEGCRRHVGFQESLSNGVCDETCNTPLCRFDGGDCVSASKGDCSSGCFSTMLDNGICDTECLTADCFFDHGDCELCAAECYVAMLGDGVCNDACNVEECGHDGGDCTCAPGCLSSLLSNEECDEECAFVSCSFDSHLCVRHTKGDCGVGCFDWMIGDGHCDTACNSVACEWDKLDCGCAPGCGFDDIGTCKAECFYPQCNYGLGIDQLQVLSCADAYQDSAEYYIQLLCQEVPNVVTMNCCENCCDWMLPSEFNQEVCVVLERDTSSASTPQVLYVAPDASAQTDGSAARPCTLQSAFARLSQAYTTFLLLPGEHDIRFTGFFIQSWDRPHLSHSTPIKKLLITPRDCVSPATGCERVTIRYAENYVYIDCNIIASMEMSHVDFSSPLLSLDCSDCLFELSLFLIPANSELVLTHVAFRHFHGVLNTVVRVEGGRLALTDVDFEDLVPISNWKYRTEAIAACCGAQITYKDGTVTLLNNGVQYDSSAYLLNFLSCETVTLTVSNVTFSHNFAEAASQSAPTFNLIKLGMCKQCSFRHCVFRNNIANSIFHYQGNFKIIYPTIDTQYMMADSIEFSDCEFVNNTATFGSLTFHGGIHLPDVTIRNCTFTNELSASYGIVAIQAAEQPFRSTGAWKYIEKDGRQVRVDIPAASAELADLRFVNCTVTQFGLIAVTNFPKVLLSRVEIDSSGAFQGANRYTNTLRNLEDFGASVPGNTPPVPAANCESLLNFTSVRNLTISQLRSNTANCRTRLQVSGDVAVLNQSAFSAGIQSAGALLLVQVAHSVQVLSTVFTQIWNAVGIIVAAGNLLLSRCSFLHNMRAVVVQNADRVVLEHSDFSQGQQSAVTLYLARDMMYLTVRNCTFDHNVAADNSGTLAVLENRENAQVALLVTESRFVSNQAPLDGALLFLQSVTFADDSEMSSCEFCNNTVGTIYITSGAGPLRMIDCAFSNNTGGGLFWECSQPCSVAMKALTFLGNTGAAVTLRGSAATGADLLFRMNQGVCLHLSSSALSASALSFSGNSAEAGTALSLFASRVILTGSTFRSNAARTIGGGVLAEGGSEFHCADCLFESLSASVGGAIFAKHESAVYLRHSRFLGNSARDAFAVILASSSLQSLILDSEFEGNFGEGLGVISLMNAALVLANCTIHNNTSAGYTAGLVVQLASVLISRSELSSQRSSSGCFLYASHSEVRAEDSHFSAGVATASGGAVLALESVLSAENCTFRNLTALGAGALALQGSSSITLKDCHFLGIVAKSSGRGVIEVSESILQLSGAHFQSYQGSAIVGEAAILDIEFSEFADSSVASAGGGIACEGCSNVTVANSLFTRLRARDGSAVYLHSDGAASTWQITDCEFSGNSATSDGTVWMKGAHATVSSNSFIDNRAGGFGGGLVLLGLTSVLHSNVFINNRAYQGAAIYWRDTQPTIAANVCEGNVAEYGDCVGSFAVALRLEDNFTLAGLPSGQVSSARISLLLVDHYGQTVFTDSSSDGWLTTEGSDANLTGVTHTKAVSGRFLFTDFAVIARPKSNASVLVYTSALNTSHRVEVGMRDCARGEMLSVLECVVCEAGTYSLDPSQPCKKCPPEAICLGNFTLTPRPGYWRQNEHTDNFLQCPNEDACLGSPGPTTNLTGECADGYEGNKCQSCSIGYYRWGKVSCAKCPSVGVQVAVRLSIVIFVSALVTLIIRSALREHGIHSTYAKVYVDYLQLVMLLGSFHLQWPYIMLRLFNAQESIGAFLEIAFSLRCLWVDETESDTYFHELILFSLFPPFLVGLSCSVWMLIFLCKRQITDFSLKLLGSATVLYFLAYPSVVRVMTSAWTFEEIGPGELWVVSQQHRAFSGSHLKYAVGLALPCGLLYGVLIPLGLAVVMKKNNKTNRWRLGFLTQGYRPEMYYWEIVTTLRPALVVVCIPLFSRVSPAFQVLSALAVLFGSLFLHRSCRPFSDSTFNVLESRALIIVIMTLYTGLFYYAAKLSAVAEIALSAFLIGANVYFSIRCWSKYVFILVLAVARRISKELSTSRNR